MGGQPARCIHRYRPVSGSDHATDPGSTRPARSPGNRGVFRPDRSCLQDSGQDRTVGTSRCGRGGTRSRLTHPDHRWRRTAVFGRPVSDPPTLIGSVMVETVGRVGRVDRDPSSTRLSPRPPTSYLPIRKHDEIEGGDEPWDWPRSVSATHLPQPR